MPARATLPRPWCRAAVVLGLIALACPVAAAGSALDCGVVADRIERAEDIPPGLLQALALAESGHKDPEGRHQAWPWAVRSGADGFYLASKEAALAKVQALRSAGRSNIDVGCMQINLGYHGSAFGSLEDAFDPIRNVAYGARFLKQLQRETGSWATATGRYHSGDHDRGQAYRARVYRIWRDLHRRQGRAAPMLTEATFLGGPARLAGSAATSRPDDGSARIFSPSSRGRGGRSAVAVLRGH